MAKANDYQRIHLRARRVRHFLLTATMLLAPALLLVSVAIEPSVDWSDPASVVAAAIDNPTLWQVQAILAMAGFMLLVPAAIGIAQLIRPRRPGMAVASVTILGIGAVVLGAGFTQRWALAGAAGLDPQVMAAYWEAGIELPTGLVLFPFIWFAPLGMILLGVSLWRSRSAPTWVAFLGPTAFVVMFLATGGVVGLVSGIVWLVSFAVLAWSFLTSKVVEVPDAEVEQHELQPV